MKIVIVSDSHGDRNSLQEVLNKEPHGDIYLHAGDSQESPEDLFPFLTVKGNCDYLVNDLEKVLKLNDDYTLYMCHGHNRFLSHGIITSFCKKNNYQIFIHGHTHKLSIKEVNGILIICPGSISRPRSGGKTYVVLDVLPDGLHSTVKTLDD